MQILFKIILDIFLEIILQDSFSGHLLWLLSVLSPG